MLTKRVKRQCQTIITVLVNLEKKVHLYKKDKTPQKFTKVATIGTVEKDHFPYGRALFQYFQKDLGIPAETTYAKIQQPVKSDPEEYKDESNNSATAQAKSTVNKKPKFLSLTTLLYHQTPQSRMNQHNWTNSLEEYGLLFGNLIPTINKTDRNMLMREPPPTQLLTKLSTTLSEKPVILQPIGKINKRKQPELAPEKHPSMQTPNLSASNSKTLSILQIMAYQDIAKLEKFSSKEDNAYI
ncbi:hypothetical protein G9A89_009943 [Geosiphon pyriformis]|nr:hypothetical protein G9A89_009943 [Geosiphon pyriformis]